MSDQKNVRAPYNFIPFAAKGSSGANGSENKSRVERVLVRYRDREDIPRHDTIDPALKTGEIHVTMTAETPVFVSDGNEHFFRGPNGKLMLPGSTIRGMVRENMQILGFGAVVPGEDLVDYQVYFREIAGRTNSIKGRLKKYYHGVMKTETRKGANQKAYSIPKNVRAGYLRKREGVYYIQPVKDPYIRVPRKNKALMRAKLVDGEAKTEKVAYTASNGRLKSIQRGGRPVPDMEQGVLLYTGKSAGNPNARYLFPTADEEAAPVLISEEDRISYQEDFETRRNVLGKTKCGFWALPEEGEEKPVFYVRHDGHTYFGMSLFLRIGYSHKFSDGLPKSKRKEESIPLDYPHAMLGFAGKEHSYRSRVSFGDFLVQGEPSEGSDIQTILLQPKPSWYAGYVENGKHYNDDEFYLRGYKLYWLKDPGEIPKPDKENVASTLRPLPEGTEFRGVIRYKNLHEDELGLLLWALRLDDPNNPGRECFQSIGMGKPYGFGRMKLTIDSLREYDLETMYTPDNLCGISAPSDQDSIARYIKTYNKYACGELYRNHKKPKKTISCEAVIKDFFYMRGTIRDPEETGYMEQSEYGNPEDTLPTVWEIREEAKAAVRKTSVPPTAMAAAFQKAWPEYNTQKRG